MNFYKHEQLINSMNYNHFQGGKNINQYKQYFSNNKTFLI
jgi:hypothetical protein